MKTLYAFAVGSWLIGATMGYMLARVDNSAQRVVLAEQAAQIVLLEQMTQSEIPRINEQIEIIEERFERCNRIAARMGVLIRYNESNNAGMGGEE